jgi:hypothetical protein
MNIMMTWLLVPMLAAGAFVEALLEACHAASLAQQHEPRHEAEPAPCSDHNLFA